MKTIFSARDVRAGFEKAAAALKRASMFFEQLLGYNCSVKSANRRLLRQLL